MAPMGDTGANLAFPEAAPDLSEAGRQWLSYLAAQRRLSPKTVEAYQRDLRQFLSFLKDHFGAAPGLKAFSELRPADCVPLWRGAAVAESRAVR